VLRVFIVMTIRRRNNEAEDPGPLVELQRQFPALEVAIAGVEPVNYLRGF